MASGMERNQFQLQKVDNEVPDLILVVFESYLRAPSHLCALSTIKRFPESASPGTVPLLGEPDHGTFA